MPRSSPTVPRPGTDALNTDRRRVAEAGDARRLPRLLIAFGVLAGVAAFAAPAEWRDGFYLLGAAYALAVVLVGLRTVSGRPRLGWILLGVGLTMRVLGDVTWAALVLSYGANLSLPSAGDAFYFVHYLTVTVAVLILSRRAGAPSKVGLIDTAITTAGLLLPAWMFAVEPYLRDTSTSSPAAVATAVAYVVCCLMLFACVARLLFVGGYQGRGYTLTAAALVTLVLGDIVYLTEVSRTGSTVAGGLVYLLWTSAYVLFGLAVRYPLTSRQRRLADETLTWQRCVVFMLVAVSAPALWIFHGQASALNGSPVVPAVIVAVLSVLLIIRLAIVARVAQRRAAELARRSTALDTALTRQQALQDELAYRALHDPLTGLGNRAMLTDHLENALQNSTAGTSLLLCDLDGFKDVNDTYGHPAGDHLLVEASGRLQQLAPAGCTLVRLGGDEFVALIPDSAADNALELARSIVTTLAQPYLVDGHLLHVTTSVGLVVTDGPTTASDVLRDADLALYAAKNAGKNTAVRFAPPLRAAQLSQNAMVTGLRTALAEDRFMVSYQPIVDMETGRIEKVEALLRWTGADGRAVPPVHFIPVAEASGLIVPIGAWVLRQACRDVAAWHRSHGLAVSVNVSGRQLADPHFADTVLDILAATGLPGSALILEITETILVHGKESDREQVNWQLHRLRTAGLRIAVDDFGTGYSSMASLQRLPVDILKIDRSFTLGPAPDGAPAEPAFIRAILGLADALSLDVIAEGVETADQRAALSALGCRTAQGYLFARPTPAASIDALLAAERRGQAGQELASNVTGSA
ncbi:putative bifunctional diguanylate cyclase/phosphodiesterase [Actinoplanes xinjiangensis]|uniref:putative bifunctional diguanylate cyclase/phosphodiesterase n=1 Tax=Actinoplanes xinjiangensis TaxID=512350 RepID=UPI00344828DD